MQITKNIFGVVVLAMGLVTVVASPMKSTTAARVQDVADAMEYYTSNAIDTPAKPPPFDPVGLQPDSMVKVVTTEDEGLALSEHHNHMVRVEAVAGELVYVLAPEPEKAATQHIGTMRGKYLEETLSKIESHLQQQSSGTMTNTTAAHTTLSEASCSVTWCFVAWGCIYKDGHCGGCIIFWCW